MKTASETVTSGDAARASDEADARGADFVAVGVSIAAIAFCLFQIVLFRYGRDQGIYAVVADLMRHGGAPYKDAWDFKPPGIFLVYAVAQTLFGSGEHAPRILEAIGMASLVWAFAILSRRFVGSWKAGVVAGACAVGTEAQLEFWHTSQPESFGAIAIAWALVCATWAPAEGDARGAKKLALAHATAGFLYASAALLKPPLGGGFVVSLCFAAWIAWKAATPERRIGEVTRVALSFAAGGALAVGLTFAYFAAKHALADLYDTLFVFTPHYTKLSFSAQWFWGFVYMAFEQWSIGFSAFIGAGLAVFLALPKLAERETEMAVHVGGVVAFQLLGVAMQAKFFPYHYGAALPLAALLAGWGAWKLWIRARGTTLGLAAFAAMLWVLGDARGATRDLEDTFWVRSKMRWEALVHPEKREETNDYLYSVADVNAGANRKVAEWLAARTPANEPVFIWGFEPEIYELAKRTPASRYVYDVPQRVSWDNDTRRKLMDELSRTHPSAIVVEHRDVFPAVTGNRWDSADSLRQFPQLDAFLKGNYRLTRTIEDFDIYVRD